jgi:predicted RNA polymerase sigma factor
VPRNPTGWLVAVGRNSGLDGLRRRSREAFDRAIGLANTAAEAARIRLDLDRLDVPAS